MSRSKWKGPFVSEYIKKIEKDQRISQIMTRNSEIIPDFINKKFSIHNGKNYSEIIITEDHVGHKFGEFAFTRSKFVFKKKKSKK
jgi:ribosomal protein S19